MTWRISEIALVVSGVISFIMSWVMEIYFHYISDYKPETVPEDLFWRAEIPIAIGSTTLFVGGIILVVIGIYLHRKRSSCEVSGYRDKSCKRLKGRL